MKSVDKKNTYTKVCGVVYDPLEIISLCNWCINHNYKYYYILHKADEEDKKDHFHFIIESNCYHRFKLSWFLNDSNSHLWFICNNVGNYLRYMTHIDYDDKLHYEINDIISNISLECIRNLIESSDVNALSNKELEIEDFHSICKKIINNELNSLSEVLLFCFDNGITYNTKWSYTLKLLIDKK